jgi:hypothetical protein
MGRIGSMKRLALILAVVAVAAFAAMPAYAANSVGDGYAGRGSGVVGAVSNGGGGTPTSQPQVVQATSTSSGSSLPFTGLDVGLLALGGIALVGVGVGLRRFARPLSS